jgi:post-segregation antitoxin (ccd killing protein)
MIVAMTETATIRVPVATRDELARLAEARGVSVSRLLTDFASGQHIHRLYASERTASQADLLDPAASAEYELWDESSSDELG